VQPRGIQAGVQRERHAADRAAALVQLGQTAALSAYAKAAQADDQVVATHAHLEFHTSLVALLGNARLVATADTLTGDLRLALASVERARRNARAQVADHRRLLTLMRSGDLAAAQAELERHLRAAAVSVVARVTRG
jgi:DNA-binding GntR family transcriptional regulator